MVTEEDRVTDLAVLFISTLLVAVEGCQCVLVIIPGIVCVFCLLKSHVVNDELVRSDMETV